LIRSIPIEKVLIPSGRRPSRDIGPLIDSIREIGLLNPIVVTEDEALIAGYHRLVACKQLGFVEIPATVLSLDSLHAELVEIDENLCRSELTALERAEGLARRKSIYEALHPGSGHGGARSDKSDRLPGYAEATAEKTGQSSRTIRRDVQVAESLPEDVRDKVRGTRAARSRSQLQELAKLPEEEQREVADKLAAGVAKSVSEAAGKPAAPPSHYAEAMAAVRKLSPEDLEAVLRQIQTLLMAKGKTVKVEIGE
jgi:ParB family chromosome partitioning protein